MLKPTKHSHPDKTVVYLAVRLLERLQQVRVEDFSSLSKFAKKKAISSEMLLLPALNLLYLLGLIEYHPKSDTIEFLVPDETL